MNTFLKELERHLSRLDDADRKEILDHYEERFRHERIFEGKTDEEIIQGIGSPEELAARVLKKHGITPPVSRESPEREVRTGRMVGVVLFDIFIAAWLLPLLFALLYNMLMAYGPLFHILTGPEVPSWSFLAHFALVLGGAVLWGLLILFVYDATISFIHHLLRINMEAFSIGHKEDTLRRIRSLKAKNYFQKRPSAARTKGIVTVAGLILLLAGLAVTSVQEVRATPIAYLDHEESVTVTEIATWDVDIVADTGDVTFHVTAGDEFLVESHLPEDASVSLDFSADEKRLEVRVELDRSFWQNFFFFGFSRERATIDIYVPETVLLGDVGVEVVNGRLVSSNIDYESLHIRTTNGDINIRHALIAENLDVQTTNGSIALRHVDSPDFELRTTNGAIELQDLHDPTDPGRNLTARSTNGGIEVENVYVEKVTLRTTNGNINYFNDDTTFEVDLDARTTNGTIRTGIGE